MRKLKAHGRWDDTEIRIKNSFPDLKQADLETGQGNTDEAVNMLSKRLLREYDVSADCDAHLQL